ncbi:hypothetical protein D3C72_902780 [compost metagenome]
MALEEAGAWAGVAHAQAAHLHQRLLRRRRGRLRGLAARQGVDQLAGVGLLRVDEDGGHVARLHQLAFFQHDGALRIAPDQPEVVRDEQHGRALVLREADHEVEHFALAQRVERGGRLVGDQQARLEQHHAGQHDALAHAARELVRVGVQAALGVGDLHAAQHVEAARANLGGRQLRVHAQALGHLLADAVHRVERDHRLLEHHADARPADGAHGLHVAGAQVFAVEHDLPAALRDAGRQQLQDGARGHGLAAARFAHHGKELAGAHVEREVVHQRLGAAVQVDLQVPHGKHGRCGSRGMGHDFSVRGSSRSRSDSPRRLMPSSVSAMHRPGTRHSHTAEAM